VSDGEYEATEVVDGFKVVERGRSSNPAHVAQEQQPQPKQDLHVILDNNTSGLLCSSVNNQG
jgi:hypothetical protein